jgi:hypothetical protein
MVKNKNLNRISIGIIIIYLLVNSVSAWEYSAGSWSLTDWNITSVNGDVISNSSGVSVCVDDGTYAYPNHNYSMIRGKFGVTEVDNDEWFNFSVRYEMSKYNSFNPTFLFTDSKTPINENDQSYGCATCGPGSTPYYNFFYMYFDDTLKNDPDDGFEIDCYGLNGTIGGGSGAETFALSTTANLNFSIYVSTITKSLIIYYDENLIGECYVPSTYDMAGKKYHFSAMALTSNGVFTNACVRLNNAYTTPLSPPTTTTTLPSQPSTTTTHPPIFPPFNITEYNATFTKTTCFSYLINVSIKDAITCLYIGKNFQRDDGVPTMGYFFYLIVFGGMVFIFYLKHRSIVISGMVMLIFLIIFEGEFPPEAGLIYWGIVLAAVVSVLYGLFKNDD